MIIYLVFKLGMIIPNHTGGIDACLIMLMYFGLWYDRAESIFDNVDVLWYMV
jgi:hypothetical protein